MVQNRGARISYQYYGRAESFPTGSLDQDPKFSIPRWFRIGEPRTDVATQVEIVEKLIGELRVLPERVTAVRWNNHISFFEHGVQRYGADGYMGMLIFSTLHTNSELFGQMSPSMWNTSPIKLLDSAEAEHSNWVIWNK
eukprot:CAMPEP_0201945392 /NCGR_PEP_ID=MMETSP0903-20130614/53880_1 /ASSEMBLY_ACC=CAM_ASM_000552 /TAXON_ID=420261 /ORGANISM="Thalassiosira antarctica, Strain CCMP982" /LENGTH=138 /DNA_ID=CAMNT_0048488459 /DNA_START=391 /DNA_END=807 /DNA_ORIENTATION=+